jgi:hypothetical protein
MRAESPDASTHTYYEATIGALELFRDNVIGYYENQARQMQRPDIAETLAAIKQRAPQNIA